MKKLAIVGTSFGKELAPYKDKDYEIWSMAFALVQGEVKKVDKLFEIHRKDEYIQDTAKLIYETDLPVYMQKKDKKVKNCLLFPFDKILKKYGEYFTSTWSLVLVFAIEQGFKEIEFYGVNFETDRERTIERACLEYWVGYFQGRGVKIKFHDGCPLLTSNYVYGIDNILKQRKRLEKKIKFYEKEYHKYMMTYQKAEINSDEEQNAKEYMQMYKTSIETLKMELNQI